MQIRWLIVLTTLALAGAALAGPPAPAADPAGTAAGPDPVLPGPQNRIPYYLPHLTWAEVEEYLRTCDLIILPVGSLEQHGKHLPLNSDIVEATQICLQIGQKTKVLVAPVLLAGLSEHHMAFPGTITLTPATFEAVLLESAQSLIKHGFRRFIIYSGHGGNYTSVSNVVQRINRETPATAIDLLKVDFPAPDPKLTGLKGDSHAGVEETSMMMYLAGALVQGDKIENPVITYPPEVQAVMEKSSGPDQAALLDAMLFLPAGTGKHASTRDLTNNGVVSGEDVRTSNLELGKLAVAYRVDGVVRFIEAWRKIRP